MSEQDATFEEFAETESSLERVDTPIGKIPADWGVEWLDDITEINPDGFSEDDWESDTFEYISLSEVSEGEITESETVPVDEAPSRAQRQIQHEDVLIGTVRPKQSSHGLVTSEHDGKICSSGFGVLRTNANLNSWYLLQEILSQRFFSQMEAYVAGSGYPAVKIGDLRKHRVSVPPLEEQRKIASVLYNVDQAIQKTEEVIQQRERVRDGLLQDLFQYGVNENGEIRRSDEDDGYRKTKYGEIPQGWDLVALDKLVPDDAPVVYGILKPGDHQPDGVPVVKVKDIHDGEIKQDDLLHTTEEIHDDYKRAELREGDLLFTIRGTVGRMAFVPENLDGGNITQDTARIRIRDANPQFIRYFFETETPINYFKRNTKGQAVQGINLEDLRKVPVHLPSKKEQQRIVEIVDSHTQALSSEREHRDQLKRLKQGLMQDLLSGEVRTTDVDIPVLDEVAQHG